MELLAFIFIFFLVTNFQFDLSYAKELEMLQRDQY